ncbi:hypothetical protein HYX06_01830 [Candidatus Woesearchaeota archaeon]|nr:hypothetical protein [Candidatus Woesearchaeota archaeon]
MAIDYVAPLADGRQLGTTPVDLYTQLRLVAPITGFSVTFTQPHSSDTYLLTGDGIQVTAKQTNQDGVRVVKGSIQVTGNPEVSEESIRQAILRFCLGLSTRTDTQ